MPDAQEFRIHGMDCADEVALLRREVGPIVGSTDRMAFDILRGKMSVAPGPPDVATQAIVDAVARTGMRAVLWTDVQPKAAERDFWERRGRTLLTAVSGVTSALGFGSHVYAAGLSAAFGSEGAGLGATVPAASKIFYGIGIISGSWFVAPRALARRESISA